ncbi:MAG: hypothetical protein FWD77_11620 [Betaproteobacteria bacterium]|nr:hypothetical protein [Betaproteobacteria bacterium]
MKIFHRKKLCIALGLALGIGAGSACATTTVSMTGTAPGTLGGTAGANTRLYVPLNRTLSIVDSANTVFGTTAADKTITLTLSNGAVWTSLATTQFSAANVSFQNTGTCSIDFTSPATIWDSGTPETITFTTPGCHDDVPGEGIDIDLSTLTGTVIDLSGASPGNITITVAGTIPGVAGNTAPVLVEILDAPSISVSAFTAGTYTAGSFFALQQSMTLSENANGALGCDAGATADSTGATISLTLPAGVQFDRNIVPSVSSGAMTFGTPSASLATNTLYIPCTRSSMDSASYTPATISLISGPPFPSVSIPASFTGDLEATLTIKLSDGTDSSQPILLATQGGPPPAAGLTGSRVDNPPSGLQTVFTGRTYGRDTAGQLHNPAIADQFKVVEDAAGTIPATASGVRPKFTVTTGNAAQNTHATVDANATGVYRLTETPNPLPFSAGGNASAWYVNDGDNGTSVNADVSTVTVGGHTFTFPGLTIGKSAGDVTATASVSPGNVRTTAVTIATAINATTFSTSGAQVNIAPGETATGPTMILKESVAGALQAEDGTSGTVAFDLLAPSAGQSPAGQWILDRTTATWCGQPVPAANLWMTPGVGMEEGGTRLYVKLPSISSPNPCSLQVLPALYAQNNAGAGYAITAAVFDPRDSLKLAGRTYRGTAPYASADDIASWAQPSINNSAIQRLGAISGSGGGGWGGSPVSLASATGGIGSLSLSCRFDPPGERQGRRTNIYVAIDVPGVGFFFMNSGGGWEYFSNAPGTDWAVWKNENLSAQPYIIQVSNGINVSAIIGSTIYIGWGDTSGEIAALGLYGECYTIR